MTVRVTRAESAPRHWFLHSRQLPMDLHASSRLWETVAPSLRQENVLIDSLARVYMHWFRLVTVSPTNDERVNDDMR